MNKEFEKIWQCCGWTRQANKIVDGIQKFPEKCKLIILLRHSHRNDTKNVKEMVNLGLTIQGHEIAKKFGELLPNNRPLRLFFSISPRCRQTAEDILIGFKKKGGKGQLINPLNFLYNIGEDSHFITYQAFKHPGEKFITHWASDSFPGDKIKSFSLYIQEAISTLLELQNKTPKSGMNILISHDLHIIGLRLGLFNLSPNNRWVSYLGGLVLCFTKGNVLWLDIDESTINTGSENNFEMFRKNNI